MKELGICEICSKEFIKKNSRSRFCSPKHDDTCPVCGNFIPERPNRSLGSACSPKCTQVLVQKTMIERYGAKCTFISHKEQISKTNLERYGASNLFESKEIQNKIKENNLKKFGVEYNFQRPDAIKKYKETMLSKYGVENPFKIPSVKEKAIKNAHTEESKEKRRKTCLERYGDTNVLSKNSTIREKVEQTNLERYGSTSPLGNPEIYKKIGDALESNYGVRIPLKSKEIKEKQRNTIRERYGVDEISQLHIQNFNDWENFSEWIKKNSEKYNLLELSEYFGINANNIKSRILEESLSEFIKDGLYKYSTEELKFIKILDAIGFKEVEDYIPHYRGISGVEADFYFPKYRLAVEISPTWTHRIEWRPEKCYHYNKYKKFKDNNISLITIFDWVDREYIESLLRSYKENTKLTSPLIVKEISPNEALIYAGNLNEDYFKKSKYRKLRVSHTIPFNETDIEKFYKKTNTVEYSKVDSEGFEIFTCGYSEYLRR